MRADVRQVVDRVGRASRVCARRAQVVHRSRHEVPPQRALVRRAARAFGARRRSRRRAPRRRPAEGRDRRDRRDGRAGHTRGRHGGEHTCRSRRHLGPGGPESTEHSRAALSGRRCATLTNSLLF